MNKMTQRMAEKMLKVGIWGGLSLLVGGKAIMSICNLQEEITLKESFEYLMDEFPDETHSMCMKIRNNKE